MTFGGSPEPRGRWAQLAILATTLLLALVPWFSAASVAPLIADEWQISRLETAFLTVAVQFGFVVGALAIAFSGAADVIPARRLIAGGALLAAVANAVFALFAVDLVTALPMRALSGLGIAAVYPMAMKVVAGWFRVGRGLAVGVLIGAITLGSALPHLIRAGGAVAGLDWRLVVLTATVPCLAGALLALVAVREGPMTTPAARLSMRLARAALGERSVRLANLGYLGHMWELYAMWTWVPAFVAASLAVSGDAGIEASRSSASACSTLVAVAHGRSPSVSSPSGRSSGSSPCSSCDGAPRRCSWPAAVAESNAAFALRRHGRFRTDRAFGAA